MIWRLSPILLKMRSSQWSMFIRPLERDDVGNRVLFNGEIYNFRVVAAGQSDSDSILPGFRDLGARLGSELDGEFTICVHAASEITVHLRSLSHQAVVSRHSTRLWRLWGCHLLGGLGSEGIAMASRIAPTRFRSAVILFQWNAAFR